jgi:hypothetical protein
MEKYKIQGFSQNLKSVIFFKGNRFIFIKTSLPKNEMMFELDIPAKDVDKQLRDDILDEARKKGRCIKQYSMNGENDWDKDCYYEDENGDISFFHDNYKDYKIGFRKKYSRYISEKEVENE